MSNQTIKSSYDNVVPLAEHISRSALGDTHVRKAVYKGSKTPKQMLELADSGSLGNHFIEGQHYASVPNQRRIHIWEQSFKNHQGEVYCQLLQSFKQTATEAEIVCYRTWSSLK